MVDSGTYYLPLDFTEREVNIALIGAGGTGGEVLDGLVRTHFVLKEMGHPGFNIHLFDFDTVSASNVARTKFSPADIGQNKALLLAARYNQFYGMDIKGVPSAFKVEDSVEYDLVIGATDSAQFRVDLGEFSKECRADVERYGADNECLYLDLGNDKDTAQFILGHIYTDKHTLLPNVYDLYGAELEQAAQKNDNKDSCSLLEAVDIQSLFINRAVATHACNMVYTLFKTGKLEGFHGGFLDLQKNELKPLPIDENVWRFLGFEFA